jgi:hypothetical protein
MNAYIEENGMRSTAENAGYKAAYVVMSLGLLGLTMYRSFVEGVETWELLSLVVIGGAVSLGFQLYHGTYTRSQLAITASTMGLAAIVAIVMLYLFS